MPNKSILLLLISFLWVSSAFSQLFDGRTQAAATLERLVDGVKPGSVVVLGENHGLEAHRDQHMAVLEALRSRGLKVSVGLEFINYTDQSAVDSYRAGQVSEDEFLKAVSWGGIGFEFYRPQLLFPDVAQGERSLGLNLPRAITSKISKNGLASLTPEDLQVMPPAFQLGRDSYKARFMEAAGVHCRSPENCFAAQCAWDDTMAWQAVKFIEQHPDQVLVIVVGEFHVQYGGGLPHRILQRAPKIPVLTLSQVWTEDMTDEEIQQQLQPSETEGPRADFIWLSKPAP